MKLRSFLTISAVAGLVYAVGLLLMPAFVATMYGLGTSASEILLARLFGGTLLARPFFPENRESFWNTSI